MEGVTIGELMERVAKNEKQMRTEEGFEGVSFTDNTVTLDGWYYIELERVKTPLDLLGWVAQLSGKKWVTRKHIYHLIKIASGVNGFNPHEKVCPMNKSERIKKLEAEVRQLKEIVRQLKALAAELEKPKAEPTSEAFKLICDCGQTMDDMWVCDSCGHMVMTSAHGQNDIQT